uniref:Protein SCAI n=1 Tax=Mesocestoides corti TaxID=53468 RepID=A0A5K3F380_MESCO
MASVERLLEGEAPALPETIEADKLLVSEFCHLYEKSKQLFNGLRDLPQYGHKQWQTYFGRTFDVYTKLWKFQRDHRSTLDEVYGLKRWQIGEIASKIGQLYYHYYLRTSDIYYLQESYSFFSAIRSREYFARPSKDNRSEQVVKKLRYYARYIIVCLLLKRVSVIRELLKEFSRQINEYAITCPLEEHMEWNAIVQEIREFVEADNICTIISADSNPVVINSRLSQVNCFPAEKSLTDSGVKQLQLAEILIIGNTFDQIRFSEITLDMFRMLQCVERDPQDNFGKTADFPHSNAPGGVRRPKSLENGGVGDFDDLQLNAPLGLQPNQCNNPHKYLLYKPSFSQFNTFMAAGLKDLPSDGVLLLYLSADGMKCSTKTHNDPYLASGYDVGGVVTNSQRDHGPVTKPKKPSNREPHCIHPGDLYPYTRRPLFLIVDSDNSSAFKHVHSLFGQPLVALLSPETVPEGVASQRRKGSMFTLFLHCPLTAYLHICGLSSISLKTWERGQSIVNSFMGECYRILLRARHLGGFFCPVVSQVVHLGVVAVAWN